MNGGAVAYLTQSAYGRNKIELTINNYYTSDQSPYKVAVTGLAGNSVSETQTSNLSSVYAYNTTNGMKASTTGNATGIYDLSGGVWDRISGYISNGNNQLINDGRASGGGSSGMLMGTTSIANVNGYQTLSTRNCTVYPYNDLINDSSINNYNIYKNLLSNVYGYGDSVLETSNIGSYSQSWNSDCSYFPTGETPFYCRGCNYSYDSRTGIFAFSNASGGPAYSSGYRIILISE